MTMPKGWKSPSLVDESTGIHATHFSGQPDKKPEYRNPIPPPSRVTWPSGITSSSHPPRESSGGSIAAVVIIAVIVVLIVALVISPYLLILIPMIIIGAVRGLKRGSGRSQYHDNMSRRGHRSK